MKKTKKLMQYVIVVALSLLLPPLIAYMHFGWGGVERSYCYLTWCIFYAVVFFLFAGEIRSLWGRILAAGIYTVCGSACLIVTNVILNCQRINRYVVGPPATFLKLLPIDLMQGGMDLGYPYPVYFAILLLLCGIKIFLTFPRVIEWLETAEDWLMEQIILVEMRHTTLEESFRCMWDGEGVEQFFAYVNRMPSNREGMKEMTDLIERIPEDTLLIAALLEKYKDLLTRDEYVKYRTLYLERENARIEERRAYYNSIAVKLPRCCGEMDQKFGVDAGMEGGVEE